jgi:hypothetical protein
LKQTFFYLVAFFLLADGIVRVIRFLQFFAPSTSYNPKRTYKSQIRLLLLQGHSGMGEC